MLDLSKGYRTWAQVGPYFDGDGSLLLGKNRAPFYFEIKLFFSDQSIEQLQMLRAFFTVSNLQVSNLYGPTMGSYRLELGRRDSVVKAMKAMLPFTFKKSIELQAGISYYEDRLTGNELQRIFETEVNEGRRERHRHLNVDCPYLRSEGREILLRRRKELTIIANAGRRKVTPLDEEAITRMRMQGLSWSQLQSRFPSYSTSTVRRVVAGFYKETDRKLRDIGQPSIS
jgi:hypothetical protein